MQQLVTPPSVESVGFSPTVIPELNCGEVDLPAFMGSTLGVSQVSVSQPRRQNPCTCAVKAVLVSIIALVVVWVTCYRLRRKLVEPRYEVRQLGDRNAKEDANLAESEALDLCLHVQESQGSTAPSTSSEAGTSQTLEELAVSLPSGNVNENQIIQHPETNHDFSVVVESSDKNPPPRKPGISAVVATDEPRKVLGPSEPTGEQQVHLVDSDQGPSATQAGHRDVLVLSEELRDFLESFNVEGEQPVVEESIEKGTIETKESTGVALEDLQQLLEPFEPWSGQVYWESSESGPSEAELEEQRAGQLPEELRELLDSFDSQNEQPEVMESSDPTSPETRELQMGSRELRGSSEPFTPSENTQTFGAGRGQPVVSESGEGELSETETMQVVGLPEEVEGFLESLEPRIEQASSESSEHVHLSKRKKVEDTSTE